MQKNCKIGFVIQARLTSTRFPNKMIRPFYNDQNILELLINRFKENFPEIRLIVATSSLSANDPIEKICKQLEVICFRGSEEDVLSRFVSVGVEHGFDYIMRICGDNPFIHVESIQRLLNDFDEEDYLSFKTKEGKPVIKTHYGFWTEIVSLSALKRIQSLKINPFYHEHVTNYIYENSNDFNIKLISIDDVFDEKKYIRLTVDTPKDFEIAGKIYQNVVKQDGGFIFNELFSCIDNNKEYIKIMTTEIENNGK